MSEEQNKFNEALAEWRRKYGIRDDDAVLQMLELLKLFFQNIKIEIPTDPESIQLVTIRVSLQSLAQLTNTLSKDAQELKQEIRNIPKVSEQLAKGRAVAFLCVMVLSLLLGFAIGKYWH